MCNDDLSLDELYHQKKNFEDVQGFSSQKEVAKFRFEKMQEKKNYKDIKQLVYVLAFLPSGMALYDLYKMNEVLDDFEFIELENIIEFFEEFGIMD